MNVAEYVAKTLADRGVTDCFAVVGGHATFLLDAVTREPRIKTTFVHHECAAAMAADGYARVAGKPALVLVSAGPAALNALNGVWGAYTDSVPMIVLSGAPRRETTTWFTSCGVRQLGDQECPVTGGVLDRMTKWAVTLPVAEAVESEVLRAHRLATTERPGPCWVEVPIDVQSSEMSGPTATDSVSTVGYWDDAVSEKCEQVLDRLRRACKPVILVGSGVRAAGASHQLRQLVERLGMPVVTAWACDVVESSNYYFCGRQGTIGDVGGNITVQESDFLLVLGSRLGVRQISYNWKTFAPNAFKAWVDVDEAELKKPTVKPDLPIHCDLRVFLDAMNEVALTPPLVSHANFGWLAYCRQRWLGSPVVKPEHRKWRGAINPYYFLDVLWSKLADDDVVVCGNATATIMTMQVAKIRGEQRLLSNSGAASMGWCLPAAIGAAVARGGSRVICVTGDGSIMQNIQELATISHLRMPIKIFVLNNSGYATIKASQRNLLGREVGAGEDSGVGFPEFRNLEEVFEIGCISRGGDQSDQDAMPDWIDRTLAGTVPMLCEVMINPDQQQEPRLRSKRLPDGSIQTASWEDFR